MGAKKKKGGKKAAEPKAQVSSSEQMAYKIQSLEAQLESARERVKRLSHDNEELRRTREKVEKDTHEFVAYFQKEMEKKDDLVADLRYNLRQAELSKEKELRETRRKLASEMENKDNEYATTERELRLRLKTVEDDLSMLYDFKAHKKELEAKLRDQEQQLIEKDLFHEKKLAATERKYIEEKARTQKDHDRQLKMIKRRSREEAQKDLDADTRRIITDNRRMGEELRFQLKTTDELQAAKADTEEENKRLRREVALSAEKETQYARGGHRKTREIRELTAQVQTLEKSLSQVVRDFERERESIEASHKAQTEELVLEVNGLRQLVKLKNKELRTIKKLAQTILSQRTDVEQFFLDALSSVKSDIARSKSEQRSKSQLWKGNRGTTKFPQIGQSPRGGMSAEHVELADLTLEDRERVLRLLFAKINNVQTYAGSFAHSMTSAGGGGGAVAAPESSFQMDDGMAGRTQVDIGLGGMGGSMGGGGGGGAGGGGAPRFHGIATGQQPELL